MAAILAIPLFVSRKILFSLFGKGRFYLMQFDKGILICGVLDAFWLTSLNYRKELKYAKK